MWDSVETHVIVLLLLLLLLRGAVVCVREGRRNLGAKVGISSHMPANTHKKREHTHNADIDPLTAWPAPWACPASRVSA